MGRPKGDSKYRNLVTFINKKWECNYCKVQYSGSYTRIKSHFTGGGNGIVKCPAYGGNEGDHNIIASGSSNPQEAENALSLLQVVEGDHQMNVGGSVNPQNNTQSTALLGEDEVSLGDLLMEHDSTAFEINDIENEVIYPEWDPGAVSISERDIELLQPEKYINDTIIDFYINYLKNRLPTDKQDRFHFFNCFFFPKLANLSKDNPSIACDGRAAFQRVRKWTRKVNLYEKDYILIPINYNLHWSLIVICHPGEVTCCKDERIKESSKVPCILHMDSRKGIHEGLQNVFQSYLCEEWKERHSNVVDDVSFKFLHLLFISLVLPQQENSFDCGLFLLHYVERFLEEAPINFNPFMITKFSNFLSCNWFPPPEASLKRSHIQNLIYNSLRVVEGDDKMIVGGSVNPQNNTRFSDLLEGYVADHAVNGGSNGNGALTTLQSDLNQLLSNLTMEEDDVKGQLQWLESHGKKRKRQVDDWLDELQDLKETAIDMKKSLDQFESTNKLPKAKTNELAGELDDLLEEKPLVLSNEFVGENFEENVKEMWDLLEDDQVFIIGIHGMGGVGKTFLATYMENEIKRKATFKDVFWVTVSHGFTISKLQHHIAEKIGIKLSGDNERTRATILSLALEKIEKSVLILDDVWEYIDLQKVGIPLRVNGIKLIITTRLKHVCQQMECLPDNLITISTLSNEEAWELLLLKLGHCGTPATLSPEVIKIARSVVEKCDGLPLGTSVMARTMKGKNDIHWWRHALNKLEKLEMGEEVLTVLKRSYDNLIEKDMHKCFLYCALLTDIGKEALVMELVMNVLLNGKRSLEEIFDEGHVILDKLIDHSLLLDKKDNKIRIHGLVRNMACHIWNVMVKCDENLEKIPHIREWTVDLEAVSFMNSNLREIPEGISPNCPRLSTLILSDNQISHIPDCFFTHMSALTVLDLSANHELTSLPNSLSNLRSLTSLVLTLCFALEYIPPLGELQALSKLDISSCDSILQVPEGLQKLNLKWLDMCGNVSLMLVPGCVLPCLTNMQYLDLRDCQDIKVEDVKGMSMLECFAGSFLDRDNYNRYVREIQDSGYGPKTYLISFGEFENLRPYGDDREPIYLNFKRQSIWFGDCEELPFFLPRDLAKLFVYNNIQWVCLCAALSSNSPSSLKKIYIAQCTKLKSLFCLSCSSCTNIQNLQSLKLDCLESLTAICKEDIADLTQSLSLRGMFSHLKNFFIDDCQEIETLLTPRLVPQLQNLESIIVRSCKSMKEIFAVSYSGDDDNFNITLPKLTTLELYNLPQLKTVCKGILVCKSEDILDIDCCPNLEELPRIRRV